MPKKKRKSTARRKKQTRKKKRSLLFRRWVLQTIIILTCIFLSYCVVLDYQIRREFEGKRWSIPARVYAQPDELYIGKKIEKRLLISKLKQSAYQPVRKLTGPGQFHEQAGKIEIFIREFHYWDSIETAKRIQLEIKGRQVSRIFNIDTREELQIIRLAPQLIGKIFPLHDEDRVLINFDDIPASLIQALIAVEDRNFYHHFGIDLKGILRSIFVNIISGKIAQGGSTLTQQLVKNLFLSRERTFSRKINEILMAIMLDYHYSKENILAAYVNEVYLGQNGARAIHGFGTAAEFYFSRPLDELNNAQIALLVGLVKGASFYNPRKHPDRALKRRNLVLDLMYQQDFISDTELKSAVSKALQISSKPGWTSARYPAFLDLVRRHLKRDYQADDLRNEGLRIHTTLDTDKQNIIQQRINDELIKLDRLKRFKRGTLQVALVMVNQHNGEVLALMGDRDKDKNAFNRALDAKRPIGSLIKPAIYLAALDQANKYHVLSRLDDSYLELKLTNGKIWVPKNYDNKTHGNVPLVRSLANSYNLSTVRLGMAVGLDKVIATLKDLGITSDIPRLPSILLGALELSPYEITQLYQTIASGGLQIPLRTIRAVLDSDGYPLQRYELAVREYIKPETAFLTQFLLTEVVRTGTARRLVKELPSLMPLAGKTGTTNELRDSWFAGFGDQLLAVIWLGRDDNQTAKLTGSSGAMQLWLSIMKQMKPLPISLIETDEIEWRNYPDMSNPDSSCKHFMSYPFIKSHVPGQMSCY
ncbi:MAG: penicillin-binding protein 1B [Proteobacteria bacterium]|nr:penicillin-binding protein 1B [Pseudomonadota bacterium]